MERLLSGVLSLAPRFGGRGDPTQRGALHSNGDGEVDPYRLTQWVLAAARAQGVRLRRVLPSFVALREYEGNDRADDLLSRAEWVRARVERTAVAEE